ncbi:MAG: hypothetical protein NW703_16310 [Nitrospiraceae bacterium]
MGDQLRRRDLLERIRNSIGSDELPAIRGNCPWLRVGCCREGIDRLRYAVHDGEAQRRLVDR